MLMLPRLLGSAIVSPIATFKPASIQCVSIAELAPAFRAWIGSHPPDVPRVRSLPWMWIGVLGAVVLAAVLDLAIRGARAFVRPETLGPLLVVAALFGVPLGRIILREWRRNQMGKRDGVMPGFHFTPEATLWHECRKKVWIIPRGCVQSLHLAETHRSKTGHFADNLIIRDPMGGEVVVPSDFDLIALWAALRARHPEAQASYDLDLAQEVERRAQLPKVRAEQNPRSEEPVSVPVSEITILAEAPDIPQPPAPPEVSNDVDWRAIHNFLRALFAGQGIAVQWGNEQPTGVTPVGISAPLRVQWQTLPPLAPALSGSVSIALAAALAAGHRTQWVSLRRIEFNDWVECDVNWWNPAAAK